ncbi:hypothetical protein EKK58_07260 [Candidatus Dependentiae bacterium]|nr:MAG: hypothetical protein EKK58_07260 [Candidatus Dependentiae bacterium]
MPIRTDSLEMDLLQGSYKELPLRYPSYDANGLPIDTNITGAVITAKFRKAPHTAVLLSLSTASSTIEITNSTTGYYKLKFPSALTSAMTERGSCALMGHVEVTLAGETIRTHSILTYYDPEVNY